MWFCVLCSEDKGTLTTPDQREFPRTVSFVLTIESKIKVCLPNAVFHFDAFLKFKTRNEKLVISVVIPEIETQMYIRQCYSRSRYTMEESFFWEFNELRESMSH